MSIHPLRPSQPVAEEPGGFIHRDLYRWLASIGASVNLALPPKEVRTFYLTSAEVTANFDATGKGNKAGPYDGWAICNGQNDTPDLRDRFIRMADDAAGATGGSDSSAHTHAIDHDHGSFTSGTESSHTHGVVDTANGSLHARIDMAAADDTVFIDRGSTNWTADAAANLTPGGISVVADTTVKAAGAIVQGATDAGSAHSHAVDVPALTGTSGAASATENRPAYYELVPLMRLEVE